MTIRAHVRHKIFVAAVLMLLGSAAGADQTAGHKPTAWTSPKFAGHRQKAMAFGDAYRGFLGRYKTEREVVGAAISMAKKRGFRDLGAARRPVLKPGSKLFFARAGKIVALVVVGQKPVMRGLHVVAAHVDSVRIDLKQNPVYGAGNAAWLQTHYYGGIKAYQWLSLPLELRGIVVKRDGKVVKIAIGDDPGEPVLVIPDLAKHVSRHVDRREGEEVPGEALDPILASTPATRLPGGRDPFAAEAARLLDTRWGIATRDLRAAELELVPAGSPRDVGIDRALVGGYGQDDRACVYAALQAILALRAPRHTAVVMLVDREEVGSAGNTGAQSNFVRGLVAELIEGMGGTSTEQATDRVLAASLVMSADVTGALHAQYKELYEARNAPYIGSGVVWSRRGGVQAEVLAYVRTLLDKAGISHQPARWRKSRRGNRGEATVLRFFTRHGMNGLDVSIPILSMHAPFEIISKADLYEAYRTYRAFLAD